MLHLGYFAAPPGSGASALRPGGRVWSRQGESARRQGRHQGAEVCRGSVVHSGPQPRGKGRPHCANVGKV